MSSGIYAIYSALQSRTQALDTAANNLANVGAHGFRAQRDYFRSLMDVADTQGQPEVSQVGRAVNNYNLLGGNRLDTAQGQIETTGNPLDLALQGNGYFGIKTAQGTRYTRDGGFQRSENGTLVTQHGDAVLNQSGAPITLPSGQVHIAENGMVSVSGPEGSAIVGQIGVFDFGPGQLTNQGTNLFAAADGATPQTGTAVVRQGALEGSNEDAIHGTMELILTQRQTEMMQKALSIFNSFDKTAGEDLGRI
ncbi:MAG: flagellar hook basal-body protein [Acidobacteria bacterium]|nr:flagellar hook basal-body protein [Acidobacteriota bacterium]